MFGSASAVVSRERGTGRPSRLGTARQTMLVIVGVITKNSVEATVRMAGNLGFDTFLVEDGLLHLLAKRLEWPTIGPPWKFTP